MKKSKKYLALLLSVIMIFASGGGLCQSLAADHCAYTPVVYIHGYKALAVKNADGTVTYPIDGNDDSSRTTEMVKALLPDLLKAIATNNYDDYCEKAYQSVSSIYKDISPNPDGTLPENTGVDWSWTPASVPAAHNANSFYTYMFDIRRDPLEIADDLHAYIETIKAKTGHDKVVLASRCIGTNPTLAYLYKYERDNGYADVEKCIFVYGGLGGFTHLEHILSGKIKITDDGLFYFSKSGFGGLSDFEGMGSGELGEFVFETLDMLRTTGGLNVTCSLVNKLYAKIKDKFLARVLKDYYGTSLTHISAMTGNYEAYKSYIFQEPGDLQKYAAIIEKADYYHYNVLPQRDAILKEMDAMDKPVYFIGDYGDQAAPISEESNLVGDSYSTLARQTLGATGSTVSGTLSNAYVNGQKAKGLERYISPDKQADVSTCLFPDQTWVVKNLHHDVNVPGLSRMIHTLAFTPERLTVNSLEDYPQFLNCPDPNCAQFVPAQEKNANDTDWGSLDKDAVDGTFSFLQKMLDFLKDLLIKIYNVISMQWVVDMIKKPAA